MSDIKQYGLIGATLKHSFSQKYFSDKFEKESIQNSIYSLFELESIEDFNDLMNLNLSGLNVTIPYKEQIMPFLDGLSPEANEIQAVNTIQFREDGIIGHNTDCYGFEVSLREMMGDTSLDRALILGTGGASKAVRYVLGKMEIAYDMVSRSKPHLTYDELTDEHIKSAQLIVNTTPLGTWPDIEAKPDIPYSAIGNQHFLYDLVYNPEKTLFLALGEKQGASVKNGYDMLRLQAEKSWKIWNTTYVKNKTH